MTRYRSLLIYEEILRKFQNQLVNAPNGIEGALEVGFAYLSKQLHLENVGLFWWDAQRSCFSMQYVLHEGSLMEGDEDIVIDAQSPLQSLVVGRRPVIVSHKRPWVAYIPIQSGSELMGAVRLERKIPLPKGLPMMSLPPLLSKESRPRMFPLLEDIADILSMKMNQLARDEKYTKRTRYLQAASEVASAVFERPRLRDMLETVGRSIIQNLGFDRIRFYLVDSDGTRLEGIMGFQIPDRLLDLSGESYPMKAGENVLVDLMLSKNGEFNVHLIGGRVVYVPLVVNGEILGCLAVDNLLSQQLMDEEQLGSLRSLIGQIGMAVMNARVFEDIEQQAITDGLTKLYVHRYFQQRLKEEIDRADRYSYSVALVMMDVDNFKPLNDKHGHLLGDKILETLAQVVRTNIRRIDLAARYGGDEFVLLLPEITEQEAWFMAERLSGALKSCSLATPDGGSVNISVSMGIALYQNDAHSGRDLVEAADKALYWTKKNNRGNICFYRNIAHHRDMGRSA